MTTGEVLYLLMCIGAFASFALMLAYQSWLQTARQPQPTSRPAARRDTTHAIPT